MHYGEVLHCSATLSVVPLIFVDNVSAVPEFPFFERGGKLVADTGNAAYIHHCMGDVNLPSAILLCRIKHRSKLQKF